MKFIQWLRTREIDDLAIFLVSLGIFLFLSGLAMTIVYYVIFGEFNCK
jgi:hypothetical protein